MLPQMVILTGGDINTAGDRHADGDTRSSNWEGEGAPLTSFQN